MAKFLIVQGEDKVIIYGNYGTIIDHPDDSGFFTIQEATTEWGISETGWDKVNYTAVDFGEDYEFPETLDCSGAWKLVGTEGNYSFAAV